MLSGEVRSECKGMQMANADEQRSICVAVVRAILSRLGKEPSEVTGVEEPDKIQQRVQDIDLEFSIGSSRFVMEHTTLETFSGQIAHGTKAWRILGPLEKGLVPQLPCGYFQLSVETGALKGIKDSDAERIQEALAAWVIQKAPLLRAWVPGSSNHCIEETPPGVPFAVELSRHFPGGRPILKVTNPDPADFQEQVLKRVRYALDGKCPKLQEAKARRQSKSVLVLESGDIYRTNVILAGEAILTELSKRAQNHNDIPDDVYFVHTVSEEFRHVMVVKEGSQRFCQMWPQAYMHIRADEVRELVKKWFPPMK